MLPIQFETSRAERYYQRVVLSAQYLAAAGSYDLSTPFYFRTTMRGTPANSNVSAGSNFNASVTNDAALDNTGGYLQIRSTAAGNFFFVGRINAYDADL